jgi:hypothetical protein
VQDDPFILAGDPVGNDVGLHDHEFAWPGAAGAAVGRLLSRVLRPRAGPTALAEAISDLKAEAHAAGLTDDAIDAELAAYNAERRQAAP